MPRHGINPRELDLRLHATLVSEKMNAVPGFRTSAAFFTFLRANLALPSSPSASNFSTPLLDPYSSQTLLPLGPSSLATMTSIDSCDADSTTSSSSHSHSSSISSNESIKSFPSSATSFSSDDGWNVRGDGEVVTEALWLAKDKQAAVDLVRESVKEQRGMAFQSVLTHPLVVVWWLVLCSVLWKVGRQVGSGVGVLVAAIVAVTAACLISVWRVTGKYVKLSQAIDESWVAEGDIIIGALLGDEVVGAAVLRLERNGNTGNKRRKMGGKGIVRAWTTKKSHRKKGIGRGLLEEVVRVTRERVRNSAEIGFAVEHANSGFLLPDLFNKRFKRDETRAARVLDGVVSGKGLDRRGSGRKR